MNKYIIFIGLKAEFMFNYFKICASFVSRFNRIFKKLTFCQKNPL